MIKLNHLEVLESESIHIIREAVATFKNPVMMYSIGKDSSVLLHLMRKAFAPTKIPIPLLHVDTGYKFKEMIDFRNNIAKELSLNLIVRKNESEQAKSFKPEEANTDEYIYHKKTKALLDAIKEFNFDAAFGGGRRDEEKSRAKERIFSFRDVNNVWNPKKQRPELWNLYNTKIKQGETMRIFPLSNWTELDIWTYIKQENISIVPLYFAQKRKMLKRNGVFIRVDEFNIPKEGEEIFEDWSRFRTLGCSPSTGAIISKAGNLDEIIEEIRLTRFSERQTRAIDNGSSMESKKKQGYF
ncbi:MAG: sulfate adenylyltransferase subunit CysD [Candidatus Paceibacterota bacterium]|jgi:sulfate adenylyltransferase subunit 2